MSSSGHPSPSDASTLSVDRISQLPEALILHIISFLLSTRDRIITGALAKRWQYLWTRVPNLYFNCSGFNLKPDDCINLVNQALILRSGSKVDSFGVKFYLDFKYSSHVDVWARFAGINKVEKLELDFSSANSLLRPEEGCYTLPHHLYRNSSFKELRFCHCGFSFAYRSTISWNSLKKLSIGDSDFSDELVEKILAGAPALEILDLHLLGGIHKFRFGNSSLKKLILELDSDYVSELEISAPKIRSLKIDGYVKDLKMYYMPSLVEATFRVRGDSPAGNAMLNSFSAANTLTLTAWFIEGDWQGIRGWRSVLLKCKYLTIDIDAHSWLLAKPYGLAGLLRYHAPKIETLTVTMSYDIEPEYLRQHADQEWQFRTGYSNCMSHLRIVKFDGLWEYRLFAFSFVQFLLMNAKVLQKMIIKLGWNGCCEAELFETLQKLLSFERSSTTAKLFVYK